MVSNFFKSKKNKSDNLETIAFTNDNVVNENFIKKLNLDCSSSISIENTIENCKSSKKAKLPTLFYPGEYTFFRDSDNFTNDIFKSVGDFFKES